MDNFKGKFDEFFIEINKKKMNQNAFKICLMI